MDPTLGCPHILVELYAGVDASSNVISSPAKPVSISSDSPTNVSTASIFVPEANVNVMV